MVKQLLKYLSFLAWDAAGYHHKEGASSATEQQWQVAAVAAGVIVREVEECVVARVSSIDSNHAPSATTTIVATSALETNISNNESMPLIKLITFIREAYGIAATNFQDVLHQAAENLSAEELEGLAPLQATRDKALYIARCAGL